MSETTEVPVRILPDGALFRVGGVSYKKIYHNECRAYVEPLDRRHNVIEKEDGEKVEWDSRMGRVNISPNTMAERIEGAEAAAVARTVKKRGGKEPSKPIKQCKKGTKRGAILDALMAADLEGDISVAAVTAKLGITRSLLLTHCFEINRDHGMGYAVDGDTISIEFLDGVDPFGEVVLEDVDDLV